MALDNRDQIMKDIDSLSLEKYIDELVSAIIEGLGRCKTEKDIWGAVEVWNSFVLFGIYLLSSDHFCFTPSLPKYLHPGLGLQSRQRNQPPAAGRCGEPNTRAERERGFRACHETASCGSVVFRISAGRYHSGSS